MEALQAKACHGCNKDLALGMFYSDTRGKYGVRSKCKNCMHGDTAFHRERKRKPRPSLIERFRAKIVNLGECWIWMGGVSNGYGIFATPRGPTYAHRFSYETWVGHIPDGLTIDHLCFNRKCVNPIHMEPVTSSENTRRGNVRRWGRVNNAA